jgi:CHAT domain-containing protein
VVLVSPDGHEALGVRHRVSVTPSASLLALLRGRGDRGGQRMLAIAGAPAPGHAPLAGARREVGELATRYQGVDAWVASARGHASLEPGRLADYRAFHFAGHAHVDDQLPWRSGLLIGADARGEDSLLTADRIAASRLKASLVVLSSCESGRGRARAGEGVSGLASAFLAAGGSAVVASLWPVEDRATERLMTSFYDGLARGLAADRALADAQASVRADPASAAPFYWAGFVLIGDGRTTLPLARRWLPFPPAVLALCLLAILAVVAGLIGWTRSRTSGGSGDDPRP